MEYIELKDLKVLTKRNYDNIGNLCEYHGRLLRLVNESKREYVRDLLKSEAFQCLVKCEYFVQTWICDDLKIKGDDNLLIIEQERVPFLTYCTEWTLEMQKAAAIMILEAIEVLMKYDYELRYIDFSDVVMNGCKPMLCDIGNIKRIDEPQDCFNGYVSFYENIYLRLKAQENNPGIKQKLADQILKQEFIDPELLYYLTAKIKTKFGWYIWEIYRFYLRSWSFYLGEKIPADWNRKKAAVKVIHFSRLSKIGSVNSIISYKVKAELKWKSMRRKIEKINSTRKEKWADYANLDEASVRSDYRRQYIFKKITELGIKRTTEMGGNAGMFSSQLVKSGICNALVTDFSREAMSKGFNKFKRSEESKKLNYAYLDFTDWSEVGETAKSSRMKSDCLIVMAMTHHLLLAQNVHLWAMVDRFYEFTNKYLIVEFMPRGVEGSPIPDWYGKEWFENGLTRKFTILSMVSDEAADHTRYIYTCMKNEDGLER